jgi:hypothetical protein
MDVDDQRALGRQLFDLWLATSLEKITAAVPVGAQRFLVVASDIPKILNLPWELLLPTEDDFLGINPLFRIRRFPSSARQMASFAGKIEALFRAIYGQDMAYDSCDLGTFEELDEVSDSDHDLRFDSYSSVFLLIFGRNSSSQPGDH